MRFSLSNFDSDHLVHQTAAVFRLLTVALAALLLVLSGDPFESRLLALGLGYVCVSGILLLLMSRLQWTWLIYPTIVIDIAALTAVNSVLSAMTFPFWLLYIFPISIAVAFGRVPTIVALAMSVLGYLATVWFTIGSLSVTDLRPIAVLAVATLLITMLASQWLIERQEKRGWREIAAAGRALGGTDDLDGVASRVVEQAQRLVRGKYAWIWWCDERGRLHLGPKAGKVPEEILSCEALTPALIRKVDRGNLPLAELGGPFINLCGEVIGLRYDRTWMALLVIVSGDSSCSQRVARERLRVFAPWASEALAKGQALKVIREDLGRESSLINVANDLAETFDQHVVERIVVDAASAGLKAAVSLVERPSGRIINGDVEVTEALVRLALDLEHSEVAEGNRVSHPEESNAPLSVNIAENRALIAWRSEQRFDKSDELWLDRLAMMAQRRLTNCGVYEQLQHENRRFHAALNAIPAPVAMWSADGSLVFANSAYCMSGLDASFPKELGLTGVREEEVIIGNPPRVFVVLTAPTGEGKYVVSLYCDITREREALRAKDELIAMVGHELRTPLSSIYGYSQMMARHLSVVEKQVGQINQLLGDFVDAARVGDGNLQLNHQLVSLAELVRLAAERFRGAYEGRKLRLRLEDVPSVEGDPARLGQVLDNLLSNAAKYSLEDQEIVLTLAKSEGRVVLSVQDHGIGLEAEHLSHIFERFYRVPSTGTERVKGTGLGLAIVKDLVVAHGGQVWAESQGAEQGSTFWVSLPVPKSDGKVQRFESLQAG